MKILMLLVFLFSLIVKAHEGHFHLPANLQPPHGGILQASQDLVFELVQEASQFKCYPMTKELKPIPLSELSTQVIANFPNKTKNTIALKPEDTFYSSALDFKNQHRLELFFTIKYKNKNLKLKFQLEPQS